MLMRVAVACLDHAYVLFFFFKQKTAYEMRISDWSSDVCSSDLRAMARTRSRASSSGAAPRAAPTSGRAPAGERVAERALRFRWRPCTAPIAPEQTDRKSVV